MAKTWRDRLLAAVRRGGFVSEDSEISCAYETCAIGEKTGGRPLDDLSDSEQMQGLAFHLCVMEDDITEAITIYNRINPKARITRADIKAAREGRV